MSDGQEALPAYDRVIFSRPALELCLVQVKYPALPRFGDDAFLAPIKEALSEEYPLTENEKAMNIVVTPQGISQAPGGSLLRFTSIDRRWSVLLSNDAVSLETRQYSEIGELSDRFTAVLKHVATHLKPRHQLRFGLRYVNEFRHTRGRSFEGWQQLMNADLLGFAARGLITGDVEQTVNEIRLRRRDGILLIRHGFLSGTTVAPIERQEPKSGPFYLLDLDYFDDSPKIFEPDLKERMQEYNDMLYRIFRWSIGEQEIYRYLRGEA